MENLYHSGPLAISLDAQTAEWRDRAAAVFSLYAHWDESHAPLTIQLHTREQPVGMTAGNFMRCLNLHVDQTPTGLYATCPSGASGCLSSALQHWDIYMPTQLPAPDAAAPVLDDNLEDLLELAMTTAWRQFGWVPLHAGAVMREERCVLMTAPSRGGKTTMTLAMLHRGWKTLGDDKLLVKQSAERCAEVYALQSVFNIDPQTRRWFPEVGDLTTLPLDSLWTPKRRVPIERIWGERMVGHAEPTHLVQIQRFPDRRPTAVEMLDENQVLSALLHQTVVPIDRVAAKQVISVIAPIAKQVRGMRLELGENAYDDPRALDRLERLLQ